MPKATLLADCTAFAREIAAASGVVPAPLQRLLDVAEMLMAPAATQDPSKPLLDQGLEGKLDPEQLDAMIAAAALRRPSLTIVAVCTTRRTGHRGVLAEGTQRRLRRPDSDQPA